jgi:hypothetical protein
MPFLCASSAPDPMEKMIPLEVLGLVHCQFPSYRLARLTDYSKDDLNQHKKDHHGNPCIGCASADVDEDGFPDFAFYLTNNTKHTLLMAARNPGGKVWVLEQLMDFGKDGPGSSYVEYLKPGKYADLFSTEENPAEVKPEPGSVRKFHARHPGFLAGTIESSAVAFFFNGKRWIHLWLGD